MARLNTVSGQPVYWAMLLSLDALEIPQEKQTEKEKSGALFDCVYCMRGCMSHSILGLVFIVLFKTQGAQFSLVAQSCPTLRNPWTAVLQASLSITNSQSLLRLMSIESVMPSNHLIFCHSFLLPPSFFPSIRVFSSESVLPIRWPKYWSFSFSISPSNEFRTDFL